MADQPQYGLTYEEWHVVASFLKPDLAQRDYDAMWREFCEEKDKAERLKAQGVKIHPAFGTRNPTE